MALLLEFMVMGNHSAGLKMKAVNLQVISGVLWFMIGRMKLF